MNCRRAPTQNESVETTSVAFSRPEGFDLSAHMSSAFGVYRGGVTKHVVALDKDDQLTLSPTGQPTYRLTPYRDRIFAIAELDGFRVEFVDDVAGRPSTIIFHQPNGTFQAQRVTD